jgi:hypothetical protein
VTTRLYCSCCCSTAQAIAWTDEALDQLLDLSELSSGHQQAEGQEGPAAAAASSDILAGFKVAHLELREQQPLPKAAA